jgi:MFS family permease
LDIQGALQSMNRLGSSATVGALLLSISYALALFNRNSGTVLVVVLAASFHLDLAEVSGVATVFLWVTALMQLPVGLLADVLGPRRLAVLGGLVTGVGCFAFAMAQSIGTAVTARGVVAAGCSVVFVSLMRHVRTNWAAWRMATISGRSIMIGNMGAIASAAPLVFALGYFDWRMLWAGIGIISFAGATVLWFAMVDSHEPRDPREGWRNIGIELRTVVSNPYNQIGLILQAGLSGTYYALASLWAMPMLTARGVPSAAAALATSALIAGYATGAWALGWLGDRTSRRLTLTAACAGAAACWSLLSSDWSLALDGRGLGLLLFQLGFCSGAFNLVYSLITERNALEHAGTVISYLNLGTVMGAGVIQSISTNLYATTHGNFSTVLAPMFLGSLLSIVLSLSLFYQSKPVSAQLRNP